MITIGTTLLWYMLQVTVVSAAAIFTYFLTLRSGATTRSGVALVGLLLAAALAPLAFLPWPHWTLESEASARSHLSTEIAEPAAAAPATAPVPGETASLQSPLTAAINGFFTAFEKPSATLETAEPRRSAGWPVIVASLFGAVSLLGFARFLIGNIVIRRSIRKAKPIYDAELFGLIDVIRAELSCVAQVEVLESSEIATAATAGWRSPVLLLPPDWHLWTHAERRAVIAHELAHVKRRDFPAAVVSQAALTVNFYHPLAHWLAARVRLEQELAADALAASVSGGRASYLRILAELALRRSDGRVAWPARAFLPSRRTFLRRIEMLRDPRRAVDRPSPLLRIATAVCLLLFAVVVAGIRPEPAAAQPLRSTALAQDTQAGPGGNASPAARGGKAHAATSPVVFVPPTATYVMVARPLEFISDPAVQPFVPEIEKSLAELQSPVAKALMSAGVALRTVEEVAFGISMSENAAAPHTFLVLRLKAPVDQSALAEQAQETTAKSPYNGVVHRFGEDAFVTIPDDRTVLIADREDDLLAMVISGQVSPASSPWLKVMGHLDKPAAAILVDGASVSAEFQRMIQKAAQDPDTATLKVVATTVMPLLLDVKHAGVALTLGEGAGLGAYVLCDDESGAKRVRDTVTALVTMAKNMVRQAKTQLAAQPPQQQALAKMFLPIVETLLESAKVEAKNKEVTLTAESGASAAIAMGLLLPAIHQAREAARRTTSMNNLKQIGLAFHTYHSRNNHFPPAIIEEKGVKRSWRVEILPDLDQQALYDEYRKDEPWDSEHNKKVLAKMPPVFKDPSDPSGPTSTSYYLLTGNGALFSEKPVDLNAGGKGPGMLDATDGTSNTLLVVEAKRDIPWTKPEDIPFDPEHAVETLKSLGGNHGEIFIAGLLDGSVRAFATSLNPQVLKAIITPAGAEPINGSNFPDNPLRPKPQQNVPAARPSP